MSQQRFKHDSGRVFVQEWNGIGNWNFYMIENEILIPVTKEYFDEFVAVGCGEWIS